MSAGDPPFPKFSGTSEDWPSWVTKAKALLTFKHAGILDAVPDVNDLPGQQLYATASAWLFLNLVMNLDGIAAEIIRPFAGDGAGAWRALFAYYEERSIVRQCRLQAEVTSARLSNDQHPDPFFLRLEESRRQLAAQEITLPDDFLRNIVLENLPATYAPLQTHLRVSAGLTWGSLKEQIRAHYSSVRSTITRYQPPDDLALAAQQTHCTHCNRPGHTTTICKRRIAGMPPGRSGLLADWLKNTNTNSSSTIICHKCGGRGHIRSQCPSTPANETATVAYTEGVAGPNYAC